MRKLLLILTLIATQAAPLYAVEYLKQSTSATIKLGPFLDETDGKTAESALTLSQADFRLSKNGGDFAQKNDSTSATHDELGYYDVPINSTDTGTLGRLLVAVQESGSLPVWKEYLVVPANVYDSLVSGTDVLTADVTQFGGTNGTFASGRPEVNVSHFGGTAGTFSGGRAEVNTTHWGGTAVGSVTLAANMTQISGDSTAADNAEAWFDGTGYSATRSSIGSLLNEQRTIYLDPATGNDSNPGTKELPKDTFAGAQAIATPGDRILLMSNLSGETIAITVDNLTFEGAGPNITVTAATSYDADPDPIALLTGDDGTTLKNLKFVSTGDGGCLSFTNKNHISIIDCEVTGLQRSLLWTFTGQHVGGFYAKGSKFTAKLHNASVAGRGAVFEDCWIINTGAFDDGIGSVFNHGSLSVSNALGYGGQAILRNCTISTITDSSDVVGVQTPTQLLYGVAAFDGGVCYMENCAVTVTNGHSSFVGDIIGVLSSGGGVIEGHNLNVTTTSAGGTVTLFEDYVSNGSYHGHLAENGKCIIYASRHDSAKVTGPVQFVHEDAAAILVDTGTTLPATLGTPSTSIAADIAGLSLGANPNVLLTAEIATVTNQTTFNLATGADFNDAYNGQTIVLYDDSNSDFPSVRVISDYVGTTKTVTIDAAPDFTLGTDDSVAIFATAPGTTAPTAETVATAVRSELATELGRIDVATSTRLAPTTAGRTLDVTTGGAAGIDWANVENPTTTVHLSGSTISTSQAVASVSGAVGSVTGNVGGNVTGSVGSVATGGITANSFASDAITAAKLASDVTTELQSGLATASALSTMQGNVTDVLADTNEMQGLLTTGGAIRARFPGSGTLTVQGDLSSLATSSAVAGIDTKIGTPADTIAADIAGIEAGSGLDAAGVRAAIGMASANLDTQLSGKPTLSQILNGEAAVGFFANQPAASVDEEAIADGVADALQGQLGQTQPRQNRKPAPGFTVQVSRRTDGTYKCTRPIRLTAGAVSNVFVFIDMSPLFGPDDYVETVGTPVLDAGTLEAGEDRAPRDTYAMVELDGTANESGTITVPVTMTSGTTVPVVFDVEVLE